MKKSTHPILVPSTSTLAELLVLIVVASPSSATSRLRTRFFRRLTERKTSHALKNATTKDGNPIPMPTPKLILSDSDIPLLLCPAVFVASAVVMVVGLVVRLGPDPPEVGLMAIAEEMKLDDSLSVARIRTVALAIRSSMTWRSLVVR